MAALGAVVQHFISFPGSRCRAVFVLEKALYLLAIFCTIRRYGENLLLSNHIHWYYCFLLIQYLHHCLEHIGVVDQVRRSSTWNGGIDRWHWYFWLPPPFCCIRTSTPSVKLRQIDKTDWDERALYLKISYHVY